MEEKQSNKIIKNGKKWYQKEKNGINCKNVKIKNTIEKKCKQLK